MKPDKFDPTFGKDYGTSFLESFFGAAHGFSHIIVHHSATPDQKVHDWEAIRRYHMSFAIDGVIVERHDYDHRKQAGKGAYFKSAWSDIGYHFGIEEADGKLQVLPGRPINRQGGHTRGMNDKAIGICVVGNYDQAPPTEAKMSATARLVAMIQWGMKEGRGLVIPRHRVQGHRDFSSKSCPGRLFDMDQLRGRLLA